MIGKFTFAAGMLVAATQAADKAAWKQRSIYQVLTDRFAKTDGSGGYCGDLHNYCGGTFKGIENHLDYIQGMGFDAIWISPVVENTPGSYHGYHATNWEAINSQFGSEQDLKDLIEASHKRDIWVMLDVVANHVGPVGTDYSRVYPLNKAEHYHSPCQISDFGNQGQVEYCRLADLPDLDQNNQYVRDYLKNWIRDIVKKYQFDGIRIDTIPEVPKDFWSEYSQACGVFQMGENFNGDPAYVGPYQNHVSALFNYPMYYTIGNVFGSSQSMRQIPERFDQEEPHFNDIDALGVFVDNHDNPRFLNMHQGNNNGLKQATVFSLTTRGIPFVYYGTEQYFAGGADPQNREVMWNSMNSDNDFYQIISKVNAARKKSQIWNHPKVQRYVDDNFYAFSRGRFLVALTNSGNSQQRQVTYHPFNEGETVCNIFYPTTDCQKVKNGVNVFLANGESKIYVPQGDLPSLNETNEDNSVVKELVDRIFYQ